jgi:hypothetical protein
MMEKRGLKSDVITAEMLQHLPEPVQRYLNYAGVVGKPWIRTTRLQQSGRFRKAADQPWMPVTAVQTFTTDPPGFTWKARFKLAGLPLMSALDSYQDGHGHMFGKLAGLFTIFDARGEEIDQGTLVRYLGEMIWFPTAFLSEEIAWQAVDEHTAQFTYTGNGKTTSACLTFDEAGRPILFNALRYGEFNGSYQLAPWSVPLTRHEARAGLNLPVHGMVTWNLPGGNLPYYEWELGEVEYNIEL